MLCSHLPEAYGGLDADFLYSTVVIEEIGRLGLTGIGFSLHSDIVAPYILHYGSEALKLKYLPKLVRSEEHTSELQSLMRCSYAFLRLKKHTIHVTQTDTK